MLQNPYSVRELLNLRGVRRIGDVQRPLSIKDELMTWSEVTEMLGMSDQELTDAIKSSRFPHVYFAGSYFFPAEDIEDIRWSMARETREAAPLPGESDVRVVGEVLRLFKDTAMTIEGIAERTGVVADDVARMLMHEGVKPSVIQKRKKRVRSYVFEEHPEFHKKMIVEAARSGHSYEYISRRLGVPVEAISDIIEEDSRKSREKREYTRVTDPFDSGLSEKEELILISYVVNEGMHPAHVARENDISAATLKMIFKKHGAPYPSKAGRPSRAALSRNPDAPKWLMVAGGTAIVLAVLGMIGGRS